MAKKKEQTEGAHGASIVPQARSRNLIYGVLILAIVMVVLIVLVLVLLQWRNGDEGAQAPRESFPLFVDPDTQSAGVNRRVYLYFRLGDTQQLLAQPKELVVNVNEMPEEAAVRALIEGPESTAQKLTRLLPNTTKIIRAEGKDDTLYITFDRELLRTQSVGESLPNETVLRQRRKLVAQSVANTVVNLGNYSRVQILIDYNDTGFGETPTLEEFGFDADGDDFKPLPALGYDQSVVHNANNALAGLMAAIQNKDWQKVYNDFLATNLRSEELATPLLQNLREQLDDLPYRIMRWETTWQSADVGTGEALFHIEVVYVYSDGREYTREDVPVRMRTENGLWKVPYEAFERIVLWEPLA